jgi:general secretion pathway protein A
LYETFFGFREKPFNLTPDPKYLYLSERHAEAFAHLEFGRRERGGFVVITGEVGTGKTTLARYFLGQLGAQTESAFVLYPAVTATELLQTILDDLHVTPRGGSLKDLVDALHRFLLEARREGRQVVVLIDEAQDLASEVLEQIRLISNLETDTEKLLTIILVGQSELRELLSRHELRQLAQRVTARYHMAPLGRAEVAEYVRHRIEVAGGADKVAFSAAALHAVERLSGGVPRLINLLCDRALLAGYVQGTRSIEADMVRRAGREIRGDCPRPRLWRRSLPVAVALGLIAAAAALAVRPPSSSTTTRAEAGAETARDASALEPWLRSLPRNASLEGSISAVRTLWGGLPLEQVELQTHLGQIRRLDLPVVLEVFHPERPDTCFVSLLRLDGDRALIGVGTQRLRVPLAELDRVWTRHAVFLWHGDGAPRPGADPRRLNSWALAALRRLSYQTEGGRFEEAVARFQRDHQLEPDGIVGTQTLLTLVSLGTLDRPRLSRSEASRTDRLVDPEVGT